jgi:hypothetical protein
VRKACLMNECRIWGGIVVRNVISQRSSSLHTLIECGREYRSEGTGPSKSSLKVSENIFKKRWGIQTDVSNEEDAPGT